MMPGQHKQTVLALATHAPFDPDNLVVGTANAQAFALLQEWPHWHNPTTILIGAPGSGKSHIASCWRLKTNAQQFTPDEFGAALAHLDSGQPVLVEDIVAGSFDETALFHLINGVGEAHLVKNTASLLLTSRLPPCHWQIKLADLASRLKAAQLVEISQADDMMLMGILTKLFADRQLLVEPQVLRYCASRMERSFDAAVAFVGEVDRLALESQSKVNRRLVAQVLHHFSKR